MIEAFHRQRVDGLVVATLQTDRSDAALLRLAEHRMPIVLVGRELEHDMADSISAGFRRGGRIATQHLIDLGHRRIAFVGADLDEASRVTRLQGYVDALKAAGFRVRPEYVIGSRQAADSPRYSRRGTGYQATLQLLKLPSRPTAIFARNDHTAFGVTQALTEMGLSIPEDMSVVGFDNIPMTGLVTPTLTSVSQPTKDEGRIAVECLLRRIERPDEDTERRKILLECALVVRASSAQLRSQSKKLRGKTTAKRATSK
ncbi:MAG: substrate-binding domain-containing protein [Proteobacteria bacterium]|nr:substrate-binding domain-containing protein [Pseudomonadota bacterium]